MPKQKSSIRVEEIAEKYKDDSPKLIKELKKLIKEGQKTDDILLVGAAYFQIALTYYDLGDWDNMFVYSIKAVTYLDKTEEYELIAKAYMALSVVYEEQENNLMSFEACDKAYQILKKHRMSVNSQIIALNNLATCYQMMGDIKTSIKMIDECVKQIKKHCPDNIEDLAMVIINKANFYRIAGDVNKSKEILQEIHDWIDNVEFKPLVCDYYLRLALNAYILENPNEGKEYVGHALSIVPNNIYPLPLYDDFREVGHFVVLYQEKDIADEILKLMLIYEEKAQGAFEKSIAYRFMAEYYRGLGNYEKASDYYTKLDEIFEARMEEQKGAQCKAYTKMKLADQELKKMNKKMKEKERLASHESLTGLLNRSGLLDVSSDFISIAFKRKQKVGAIFVDIDFFKEVNDTYGHARGDELIRFVADVCKSEEKDNVRFARYGGDEFFGITYGLKDQEVIDIAKHISDKIRSSAIPNENTPYHLLTLSVGVINVSIKENTKTIIDMVKFADKAMYHAKNDGKNMIYLIDDIEDKNENGFSFIKIDF